MEWINLIGNPSRGDWLKVEIFTRWSACITFTYCWLWLCLHTLRTESCQNEMIIVFEALRFCSERASCKLELTCVRNLCSLIMCSLSSSQECFGMPALFVSCFYNSLSCPDSIGLLTFKQTNTFVIIFIFWYGSLSGKSWQHGRTNPDYIIIHQIAALSMYIYVRDVLLCLYIVFKRFGIILMKKKKWGIGANTQVLWVQQNKDFVSVSTGTISQFKNWLVDPEKSHF